jgi:hypothetical protein
MEEDEWEAFILEWVDSLRQQQTYTEVHRAAGGGDMGRDIIGFKGTIGPTTPWDNYQCKHYNRPLSIADVIAELGKLFYYIAQGNFPPPDQYFFIAPRGPSTDLLNCLQAGNLKEKLIARWDTECRNKITSTHPVDLTPAIKAVIDAFDIANIIVVPPTQIIEAHQKTRYHIFRFGGGLPRRTLPIPKPPTECEPQETLYVKKLLDAYADEKKTAYPSVQDLAQTAPDLAKHLHRSREQFFSAESLRAFSRDNVPPETFEQLQAEIHDGVQEVYEDENHASGFQRVVKTVKKARDIQITGNPLVGVMHTNDRAGICHQLANDDKMTWVREEKKP